MKLARHLSLKTRLAALTGCSAVAVLAIGAFLLYRNLEGEISNAITADLTVRTSDVEAAVAAGAPNHPRGRADAAGRAGTAAPAAGRPRRNRGSGANAQPDVEPYRVPHFARARLHRRREPRVADAARSSAR